MIVVTTITINASIMDEIDLMNNSGELKYVLFITIFFVSLTNFFIYCYNYHVRPITIVDVSIL
jgi:hypothetical protein